MKKAKKPFERRKMYLVIKAESESYDEYALRTPVPMNREDIIEACRKEEFEISWSPEGEEEAIRSIIEWCDQACVGDTLQFSSTQYMIYIGMIDFLPSVAEIKTKSITTVEVKVSIQKK